MLIAKGAMCECVSFLSLHCLKTRIYQKYIVYAPSAGGVPLQSISAYLAFYPKLICSTENLLQSLSTNDMID